MLHSQPTLPLPVPLFLAPSYDVVVIGGSAGGIPALITLLSELRADFPLPILVVQHLPVRFPSILPKVLSRRAHLRVKWAEEGDAMMPGTVYVAPIDQHLLVGPAKRIALSSAARVGWWRPAVDALFESAATVCGEGTIAVVLSGVMWDGAKGIAAVVKQGGITLVQDEATAEFFDMPAAALDLGRADVTMNPQQIARALQALTGRS